MAAPFGRPHLTVGRGLGHALVPVVLATIGIGLLFAPQFLSLYWLRVLTNISMIAVVAQGINLIAGFAGYPAFGNVVFFGVGAYVTAIAMLTFGAPFPVGVAAGVIMCAVMSAALGPLLFRLRGHYFAIATLGLNEATKAVVNNLTDFTGGGMGLSLPLPPGGAIGSGTLFYYAFYALAGASIVIAYWLRASRLGFACRAIRSAEEAAACSGIHTTVAKTLVWMISAALTGAAGGIYAYWMSYIEPPAVFNMAIAVKAFVIMLLGGPGTLLGPIFGAGFIEILTTLVWSHFLNFHLALLGFIIILAAVFTPNGLAAFAKERLAGVRLLSQGR